MVFLTNLRRKVLPQVFKWTISLQSRRYKSTIFALSSGHGKCGVAVIRVSGPKSSSVFSKMTTLKDVPAPRKAVLLPISDPETHLTLDKGIALWFPAPHSFTGENCCELQIHGGLAVISSVLTALGKLEDFKPASPGLSALSAIIRSGRKRRKRKLYEGRSKREFTKRAFYANKLDLTEVEGLADLIDAETEFQRRQALYQMEGNLSRLYSEWREILSRCLAFVEAYIDFSEDDNIEDNILQKVEADLRDLSRSFEMHLLNGRKGERLRSGVRTSILGAPNVGKSSLLNSLCGRPAAIVTEIPGTTRDVIETTLNINGYPLLLADTAGIRADSSDLVEKEGITRAYSSSEKSDFLLFILDANQFFDNMKNHFKSDSVDSASASKLFQLFFKNHISNLNLNSFFSFPSGSCLQKSEDMNASQAAKGSSYIEVENDNFFSIKCTKNFLIILNKIDLLDGPKKRFCHNLAEVNKMIVPISCQTEENFMRLISLITENLSDLCGNPTREDPALSQVRHRHYINECNQALMQYFLNSSDENIVIGAEYLREAISNLGKITGHVSSEELLDIIFKKFCIGK